MPRHVIASTFVTLDGYMVGADEDINWVIEGFDPEMAEDIARELAENSDHFVLGRVTYEIFVAYWPHAVPYDDGDALAPADGKEDPRIIRALNESPKLVLSTTLGSSEWNNTRVLAGGLEDEIRRLKEQPGKAISIQGSASIVQALGRADLIDEYRAVRAPGPAGRRHAAVRGRPRPAGLRARPGQAVRERRRRPALRAQARLECPETLACVQSGAPAGSDSRH